MKRVIILAAGVGQRLYPLTKPIPKCLLKVGNLSILDRILQSLEKFGADEALIVAGHEIRKIESAIIKQNYSMLIKILFNPCYAQYNNIYSLWLAREYLSDGFVLYNSDVITPSELISNVFNSRHSDFLVIDEKRELGREEMKVKIQNNRIVAISKELDPQIADGEYIGIAKFSGDGGRILATELDALIRNNDTQVFYEAALANLLAYYPITKFSTNGAPWIEVDSFADLAMAREKIIFEIEAIETNLCQSAV